MKELEMLPWQNKVRFLKTKKQHKLKINRSIYLKLKLQ